jgi:hypothetical protein
MLQVQTWEISLATKASAALCIHALVMVTIIHATTAGVLVSGGESFDLS